tara:strand:+ start:654 stop:1214 length:561 start_codon:yes stop_codon:yes gene_type:complete
MKRSFDISLSLIALLVLAIPLMVTFVIIKFTSKGSGLYWSERVGKNNLIFRMPKFRTMHHETPQVASHLLGDPLSYYTPIGKFLRQYSIDELPQLFSILKGEMSFVGPRPALFNQENLIKLRSSYKIDQLTPGVTGWAQVNGRDELTIEEKVKFDAEYFSKKSLRFDLYIIYLTLFKVIKKDGISH